MSEITAEERELRRNIVIRYRESHPNKIVMLQPKPNTVGTNEYQLCTKPKETTLPSHFEWTVELEGTLDTIWAQM